MSKRTHRVRLHHWTEGRLSMIDHWFESIEQALEFAGDSDAHTIKVFDEDGDIVHSISPTPINTYA
jgi:hypothetical protein